MIDEGSPCKRLTESKCNLLKLKLTEAKTATWRTEVLKDGRSGYAFCVCCGGVEGAKAKKVMRREHMCQLLKRVKPK